MAYQETIFNYRDLFSRADAFDMLPIITEIEGFLGESTDRGQGAKTFVSGLKLKLNGKVQIHGGNGKSVYEYNLALLNPGSPEYQAREVAARSRLRFQEKVLKAALLYGQESNHKDQHYALPLMTFLANAVMKAYFKSEREREEDSAMPFHSLLISYIRALCPADSILPIGGSYEEFPFIVFRSLNLGEAHRKMFTDQYLFMSHEFNILNMLLSRGE